MAVAIEQGCIDFAVASLGDNKKRHAGSVIGSDRGQCVNSGNRNSKRQPEAARQSKANPDTGESAGANGNGNPVNSGERQTRFMHYLNHHRRQCFGVTTLHGLECRSKYSAACGINHSDRTGGHRRIKSENFHAAA